MHPSIETKKWHETWCSADKNWHYPKYVLTRGTFEAL